MTPPTSPMSATAVRARPRRARPLAVRTARVIAPAAEAVDASTEFAGVVLGSIEGPVLRYSQRLALLRDAERRGIGRFEANLIIAAVLHRHGMGQEYELPPVGRMGWVAPALTFVGVQSAIVLGAWWVLG